MKFQLHGAMNAHLCEYNLSTPAQTTSPGKPQPPRDWFTTLPNLPASSSSLGKPEELIPTDIVSAQRQIDAVNDINATNVDHRIRVWRDKDGKLIAFISHFESMWSAFWFAPAGADYLYGATACCKILLPLASKSLMKVGFVFSLAYMLLHQLSV